MQYGYLRASGEKNVLAEHPAEKFYMNPFVLKFRCEAAFGARKE